MKIIPTSTSRSRFSVLHATQEAQAAMMTLRSGDMSDTEVRNEHPRSEQWLYVLSGSGSATVISPAGRRRTARLSKGALLVIRKRERHQIKNTGRSPLRTINFYMPPAYTADGDVKKNIAAN
jgi:oxalate decarboxylase/phosphoglucose isomerase-like protein (cupin superfamily)